MTEKFRMLGEDGIDLAIPKKSARSYQDRSLWRPGPWDREPDIEEWMIYPSQLKGMVRRSSSMGALCGYVGVPRSHALHSYGYDDDLLDGITTHGGLTFAGSMDDHDDFWYFGFDCAHHMDFQPGIPEAFSALNDRDSVYRDWNYVRAGVVDLAQQLVARA